MTQQDWEDDDWVEAVYRVAMGDNNEKVKQQKPNKEEITLSKEEMKRAEEVGMRRNSEAERMQLKDKNCQMTYQQTKRTHVLGAMGEFACAKRLGIEWMETINTFKGISDLADTIEVRTRTKHWHELIVRDDDKDESVFVLVTTEDGERTGVFVIRGYMLGGLAKREEWKKTHGGYAGAYFVPHSFLRPIQDLLP